MTAYHKIATHAPTFLQVLQASVKRWGLVLDDGQCQQILRYLDQLLLWNKSYNLTAIDDPVCAFHKHILDCLAAVSHFGQSTKTVLDIGTGAGLPAVLIAIAQPTWQVAALDSNSKKVRFIRQMTSELSLGNLTPVHERIEAHKGRYDVVTSRAFASLGDFVTLAAPCLATDGQLLAMKGKAPTQSELPSGWCANIIPLNISELVGERCLVQLKKGNP